MGSDTLASSRGYVLAMLLAIIVAAGILLTAALPNINTEVQRDQEAELIFRGEAIAAAIRAYRAKTGGYPLSLEDLTKLRPPIIRKVYRDPMTREGEWDLITAVQPGASGDKTGLPIVGVKSFCQKDSFKTYQGKTLISDWAFSAAGNLLGTPGSDPAAAALGAAQTAIQAVSGAAQAPPATPGVDPSAIGQGAVGRMPPPEPTPTTPPTAPPPLAPSDPPAPTP